VCECCKPPGAAVARIILLSPSRARSNCLKSRGIGRPLDS
jgi:hypothetical protein